MTANTDKPKLTPEQTREKISKLQSIVDELKKTPEYSQYVKQRKLSLIDHRFQNIDTLLNAGILK